jgi:integrase
MWGISMPRKAKEMGPLAVSRLKNPGRWSVGGVDGLALQVTDSGHRSWVLRLMAGGKRREMGLGSFPSVTLADAREVARVHRAVVATGTDPIAKRHAAVSAAAAERSGQRTFSECAREYIAGHEAGWRNAKHGQQWTNTLATYAEPIIGKLLVRDVTTVHVLQILEPIWTTKTETATRVRTRIEAVLSWAAARNYRDKGDNPARWKGNLDAALPKPSKVATVDHHAAVPFAEAGAFMVKLRAQDGVGARALEFAIPTAARSGEVRGATWGEIDLAAKLWVIPKGRMKAEREHRVPLSKQAISLLQAMAPGESAQLVFPGAKQGKPLSDMSLSAVLRRMKVDATPHGFRSSFRDWCAERTSYPTEVAEMALAHTVSDKVEARACDG